MGGKGGPLAFLNKKGWHPGSIQNQEKVWKREEEHLKEMKKAEELRKQIAEEREKEELRAVAEATGVLKESTRLDWMYQGGMVAKQEADKRAEEQLLGVKEAPLKDENAVSRVEAVTALPSFYAEDTPASANEVWSRLHADPLFAMRQQEASQRKAILSNPVQMDNIKKQIAAVKAAKMSAKAQKKAEKKAKKQAKKEKKRLKKALEAARGGLKGEDSTSHNSSGSDSEPHTKKPKIAPSGALPVPPAAQRSRDYSQEGPHGRSIRREPLQQDQHLMNGEGAHGSPSRRHYQNQRDVEPRERGPDLRSERDWHMPHANGHGNYAKGEDRRTERPVDVRQEKVRDYTDRRRHGDDSERYHNRREGGRGAPREDWEAPSAKRPRYGEDYGRSALGRSNQHEEHRRDDRKGHRDNRDRERDRHPRHDDLDAARDGDEKPRGSHGDHGAQPRSPAQQDDGAGGRKNASQVPAHPTVHIDGASAQGGDVQYGLNFGGAAPKDLLTYDRSTFAEETKKRLEEAAREKEKEEREKAAKRFQRREYRTGQISEDEKRKRLKEMMGDAAEHDEQRWARLKKAATRDAKEAQQDERKPVDQQRATDTADFLAKASKDVYGAGGGAAALEDRVNRRKFFAERGGEATFRR